MTNVVRRLIARMRPPPALHDGQDRVIAMQGLLHAKLNRERTSLGSLADVEWGGFSQWGEDGIIDWLISRLPDIPAIFVEFGVQNYREANTRMLLYLRNWRGLVIDGSPENVADIQRQDISWRFDLTSVDAFIDRDNINDLIRGAGISGSIGLLSIDIDGNDYWVWEAVTVISPAIVICEYNAVFGDLHRTSVAYDPGFVRSRAHFSNLFFGASLPALIALGLRKGYTFVGTNSNGCNAFFVREELAGGICAALREIKSHPSVFREGRGPDGQLTLARSADRLAAIADEQVFNFETDSLMPLSALGELYSPGWR